MTIQTANSWLLNEFTRFYLSEKLTPILSTITINNFIEMLSGFVTTNKEYAEAEITKYNPDQAEALITELNNLKYISLQETYVTLYNQADPVPSVILTPNVDGQLYIGRVNSDINVLTEHAIKIFKGGMNAMSESFNIEKNAVLKSTSEIKSSLEKIEKIVNGLLK